MNEFVILPSEKKQVSSFPNILLKLVGYPASEKEV
jgi:hypothetical protein